MMPQNAGRKMQLHMKSPSGLFHCSFHVGSGCWDAAAFSAAVASARVVFDVGAAEGFAFSLLDIGGGFPGQSSAKISFEEVSFVLGLFPRIPWLELGFNAVW